MTRRLLLAALATLALGCVAHPRPHVNMYEVSRQSASSPTYAGIPIRSGQLLLSESPGPTSFVFMLIPETFQCFTHAGIVVMEDEEPWVYEVSGELARVPFHERVLDNVTGTVKRHRLFEYVAPNLFAELVDLPVGVDGEKVSAYAREQYQSRTKFDPYFRWDEHERLFCTEFVELALRAGGAPPTDPGPALAQPSLLIAKQWLGVPTNEALPAGVYHDPDRVVAVMGQLPSRGAAFAYCEAKREIFRRFASPDQRMGYLFQLHRDGTVELRDDVDAFLFGIAHLFDGEPDTPPWGDPHTTRLVQQYADEFFGPVRE